jgi:hypothetical protein
MHAQRVVVPTPVDGCLPWMVACCGWLIDAENCDGWDGRYPCASAEQGCSMYYLAGPSPPFFFSIHGLSGQVCTGFGFGHSFDLYTASILLVLYFAMDTMGSIALDWFWFCLLLLILLRAAPSSLSNLPLHSV